jgi:hypothetical protein
MGLCWAWPRVVRVLINGYTEYLLPSSLRFYVGSLAGLWLGCLYITELIEISFLALPLPSHGWLGLIDIQPISVSGDAAGTAEAMARPVY